MTAKKLKKSYKDFKKKMKFFRKFPKKISIC